MSIRRGGGSGVDEIAGVGVEGEVGDNVGVGLAVGGRVGLGTSVAVLVGVGGTEVYVGFGVYVGKGVYVGYGVAVGNTALHPLRSTTANVSATTCVTNLPSFIVFAPFTS